MQNTRLGWILAGNVQIPRQSNLKTISNHSLMDAVARFWEIEEYEKPNKSKEEKQCEESFVKHTKRESDGRFIVKLPLNENLENLEESRSNAKSRVAPLRKLSLPRLELCGALLLSRLLDNVTQALRMKINKCFYWCDSTITLAWIKAESSRWKTFVANRTVEIQSLTNKEEWHHVSSDDNAADVLSRGTDPMTLAKHALWWHGPPWLSETNFRIPPDRELVADDLLETRALASVVTIEEDELKLLSRYSTFAKLQRVTAYLLRFVSNSSKRKLERLTGALSVPELGTSLSVLLRLIQNQGFPVEMKRLLDNKPLNARSSILSLDPFLDKKGIIRVGGRLRNSACQYDKKHPILLPRNHVVTKLIATQRHVELLHCGPQMLLASLRESYWPIGGRNLVRKVVHDCVTCFKAKPRTMQTQMGSLPEPRVSVSFPFEYCGCDYAGPIMLKDRKLRNAKLIKSYISLFVCLSTKAIHLELVSDLTTECFIAALRRFVARRGKPTVIYSDNGTNFVGAKARLNEIANFLSNHNKNKIVEQAANIQIEWRFIPPRSPNFGGLWEAGVKSVKTHLSRITSNSNLTYEDMLTVLTQIESVLNSRPLTPLSTDPNDLNPLTPSHFLLGRRADTVPEEPLRGLPVNTLSKYQHLQMLVQHFWRRWSTEYLGQLQQRFKWKRDENPPIQLGDMVIIREENLPTSRWPLGRVTQLFPGTDGKTRVVLLKTSSGQVKRAVNRICRLPTVEDIEKPTAIQGGRYMLAPNSPQTSPHHNQCQGDDAEPGEHESCLETRDENIDHQIEMQCNIQSTNM